MKSILSKSCCKKKEKPYPKLMEAPRSGCIVLMISADCGTVVNGVSESGYRVGRYITMWNNMKDYEGYVCLTNREA